MLSEESSEADGESLEVTLADVLVGLRVGLVPDPSSPKRRFFGTHPSATPLLQKGEYGGGSDAEAGSRHLPSSSVQIRADGATVIFQRVSKCFVASSFMRICAVYDTTDGAKPSHWGYTSQWVLSASPKPRQIG